MASGSHRELPVPLVGAICLMYFGAVVQIAGLVAALTAMNTAALKVRTQHAQGSGLADADLEGSVDTGLGAGVAVAIVVSAIAVGLWIWMARANARGQTWARSTATTLAVLGTVFGLFSAVRADTDFTMITNFVMCVLAVGIIVLLHRPDSREYYEAMSR
ncbi:hypothetical protein [Gordonia sp. SL306]|uniref:hypothetical protein n=1 Tax=Gordonia sp. SL306 TaxID=2995145 RepID=UPI00226E772A|nr:hypothetical protein [Gordonia sp. SL306]WAC57543.1 hypothetical protein OVA31_10065 [Gordonia sp. SL306]